MLRKTAIVALSLIVLLAVGLVVLGREATLRWAVGRLAARSDGALQVHGVSGSLFGPIRFDQLSFRHAGTDVTAQDARIEWVPLSLLWRRLNIHRIEASSLSVALQPAGPQARKPAQLPEHLSLPVNLSLDELHIDQLALTRGGTTHRLGPMTVSARTDADSWSGQLESLDTPWGKATGNMALNTQRPFAIAGSFQISKPAAPSYSAQAQTRWHAVPDRSPCECAGAARHGRCGSGNIVSRISLDARGPVIRSNADIRADTLKLNQLVPVSRPTVRASATSRGARDLQHMAIR